MRKKKIKINKKTKSEKVDVTSSHALMVAVLGSQQEASFALNAGYTSKETRLWSLERLRLWESGTHITDLPSVQEWFNLIDDTDPEQIVDEINAVEFEKNKRLHKEAVR